MVDFLTFSLPPFFCFFLHAGRLVGGGGMYVGR